MDCDEITDQVLAMLQIITVMKMIIKDTTGFQKK